MPGGNTHCESGGSVLVRDGMGRDVLRFARGPCQAVAWPRLTVRRWTVTR